MKTCIMNLLSLLLVFLVRNIVSGEDATEGFTLVPLTEANFELQKPYDIPLYQRYSYKNGVHHLWVYAHDKPHDPNSHTQPRTEIRIKGLDYSYGVWQFEGYGFVPNGTSGATIAQIHGAKSAATTIILRIYNGNMRYYSADLVAENLYDKWFKLNLIHDVDGGIVTVFIDGEKKFHAKDKGPGDLYFKCGVYAAPANISYYMESRLLTIGDNPHPQPVTGTITIVYVGRGKTFHQRKCIYGTYMEHEDSSIWKHGDDWIFGFQIGIFSITLLLMLL